MRSVLLIYPFFRPFPDLTIFRQPPLGVAYVAASLRAARVPVRVLDCTFRTREQALREALSIHADVVGIYCMVSMTRECRWLARRLRPHAALLVAGGPLPTCSPELFLDDFDVVVRGEGERAMVEILQAMERGGDLEAIPGLALGRGDQVRLTPQRRPEEDLDSIPFPARDLLPNESYIRFGRRRFGYAITTALSSRGCPYACEFCSNVIFGGSYRERSTGNLVDEIEPVLRMGYERISFADDVFTMRPQRVASFCDEVLRRELRFRWECLGRVDSVDESLARRMREAGCKRIFFGIESGNDGVLTMMRKGITTRQAAAAVEAAHRAGLQVGAFFILFYPGETDRSVLETLRFATALPLSYLGLSMPYPLPGTPLLARLRDRRRREWRPRDSKLANHVLIFESEFSETKMWFGILKGHAQFEMRRRLGPLGDPASRLFARPTDALLRLLR